MDTFHLLSGWLKEVAPRDIVVGSVELKPYDRTYTHGRIFFDLDRLVSCLVKVFFDFLDERRRRRRKDFLGITRLLLVIRKK